MYNPHIWSIRSTDMPPLEKICVVLHTKMKWQRVALKSEFIIECGEIGWVFGHFDMKASLKCSLSETFLSNKFSFSFLVAKRLSLYDQTFLGIISASESFFDIFASYANPPCLNFQMWSPSFPTMTSVTDRGVMSILPMFDIDIPVCQC